MVPKRKKTSMALVTIVFVLALLWWLWRKPVTLSTTETAGVGESSNQAPEKIAAPAPEAKAGGETRPKGPIGQERVQALKSDPYYDWKTPIEFYGKIVDERAAPVPEANVTFLWTDLSREGSSQLKTLSDEQGMFALKGVRGKTLVIEIRKEGYYTSLKGDQFTLSIRTLTKRIITKQIRLGPCSFTSNAKAFLRECSRDTSKCHCHLMELPFGSIF